MPIADKDVSARPVFSIDGHADFLYAMRRSYQDVPFDKLEDLPITLDKMRIANVAVVVAALYCPDEHNGAGTSAAYLSGLMDYAEKYLDGLFHIRSSSELEECVRDKKPATIWLIENADGMLDIDRAKPAQAGIKIAGLTHMGRNRIGDGNNIPYPDGLSSAGKELVGQLASEGFAFDVAHLAEPGFRDLTRIYEGPLLSSHTGVRALCDIPRNLTKDQIRVIFERKGVIGIAADPKMLSSDGKATIDDIFRHIDWTAQTFDADGIAIGTDFCGFFTPNTGFEDISKLVDLAAIMLAHGYPEESVAKILGKNWYDFYYSLLTP